MIQPKPKILVIRGGAIGDFILTLPVLSALREQFPAAGLELLGYPHIAQLALLGGLADHVRSIEARALAGFFAPDAGLDSALQQYFAEFGLIISFLYDPDHIFRTNIARCARAQFIAGPHRPDETSDAHAAEVFLKPLERLAIFDPDPVPRLLLDSNPNRCNLDLAKDPHSESSPSSPGRPSAWIALHPGSGSERKNWPEPKWAEFIGQLLRFSPWQLLLIGGEAEGQRLARLAAPLPPNRVELAQNLPLPALARKLKSCRAFVGHDSGISHLAAAVGLSGLVLWGETNPKIWRPRSDKFHLLLHPKGLAQLPVDLVREEFMRLVVRPS